MAVVTETGINRSLWRNLIYLAVSNDWASHTITILVL